MSDILVHTEAGVMTITFNRLDKKNSITSAMYGELADALANAPDVKEQLKIATQEAVQRGVFGAPTMFVGDQMFWGQDRLDFVREALGA